MQVAGAGLPLVFLHSGVTDGRSWAAQIKHFAPDFQVVTYDQRGHGQTHYQTEPHSPIADLLAVLDALDLQKVVLVGNSKGGRLALDFALAHPERVLALVLVGTSIRGEPKVQVWPEAVQQLIPDMEAAETAKDFKRLNELEAIVWLDGPEQPKRILGPVRDLFLDVNGRALEAKAVGEEAEILSAYDRLSQIKSPTLVIVGALDLPSIRAHAEYAAQQMPNSTLAVMQGAAHLPALEQPEAFNALLDNFLAGLL